MQAPDFSQSYNRYSYVWNNPLKYTDPDGEFIVTAIIIGAVVGAYIGGSAAEGWQMNPAKWKWDKNTWSGIGMGAIFGGAAGVGFFYGAPALANTAFFAHFGTSGTVAAYTITGGAAGGLAGYGAGFLGGMMYSKGDWKYSHQSGIAGAQVGAAMGTAVGAVAGMIQGYEVPKPPPLPRMPQRPQWDGAFFTGSEDQAVDLLLLSSKTFRVETGMWSTTRGYYFEPIQGNEYYSTMFYDFNAMDYRIQYLNMDNGWQRNLYNRARRYSILEIINEGLYLTPNIFYRAPILYHAHTHPNNNPPGSSDSDFVGIYGIFGLVVGWNNERFWYGRRR